MVLSGVFPGHSGKGHGPGVDPREDTDCDRAARWLRRTRERIQNVAVVMLRAELQEVCRWLITSSMSNECNKLESKKSPSDLAIGKSC